MGCLLALLAFASPRAAIIFLWLFKHFFAGAYHGIVIPMLGFLFLPLTLIVYTYLQKIHPGSLGTTQVVYLLIAVVLDLGLIGGGTVLGVADLFTDSFSDLFGWLR